MRELRIQVRGRPFRVLYAFDPRRAALLLIGGDKTGNDRWYKEFVPIADRLYSERLNALGKEESNNGQEVRRTRSEDVFRCARAPTRYSEAFSQICP